MAPPVCIDAPYNFVPLADWVHFPDWAERVSHDLPFRDGLSGQLELSIKAHTPILVGGRQIPANAGAAGEVYPFELPGGRYALPGSSLKGMIRSVLEIAGFSRMNQVDDVRYGLRDISGGSVSDAYTKRVRDKINTGFLGMESDGTPYITPCAMVRLSHRDLEAWLKGPQPIFRPERSVSKKYQSWQSVCESKSVDPAKLRFSIEEGEAAELGSGGMEGVPVFTGQVSDSTKKRGKKRDFVFYDEDESKKFPLRRDDWNDFLFVHGDQAKKDADDMSWPGYWKARFWNGEKVPIFYIRDQIKIRVGLAFMPRLAGDFSVKEMIGHTSTEHTKGPDKQRKDFVEALLGTVGDAPENCLKGRIDFHQAIAEQGVYPERTAPTILNGPKGSYFPNYLVQRVDSSKWKLKGAGYATPLKTPEHPRPEIRGWKRYPARPSEKVQELADEQKTNKNVQVVLNPLPAGTVFTSKVGFHNLKREELGALCWALTWGGDGRFRHGLGMGKSFGFGQISIDITKPEIRPNRKDLNTPNWQECQDAFIEHMEEAARLKRREWRNSIQIRSLLGMANSSNTVDFKGKLQHMRLEPKNRVNEFVSAKQASLVLAEYPTTDHPPTWSELEAERQAEAARLAEQEAESKRREEAAKRQAEAQAAYEALPNEQRCLFDTEREFQAYTAQSEVLRRQKRTEFLGLLTALENEARKWTDAKACTQAANLLIRIYDEIGWADPGKNKKQRVKQESKRRQRIADLCDEREVH